MKSLLLRSLISRAGLPRNADHFRPYYGALVLFFLLLLVLMAQAHPVFAGTTTLPGDDASSQMESAGTLLKFIDTGVFKWGARLFAGLCIFGSAWNLKEGRYGSAFISVLAAVLFGTAPSWVKNIFAVGGSDSVFTQNVEPLNESHYLAAIQRDRDSNA